MWGAEARAATLSIFGYCAGHFSVYGDGPERIQSDLIWTCEDCNCKDLSDADTIQGQPAPDLLVYTKSGTYAVAESVTPDTADTVVTLTTDETALAQLGARLGEAHISGLNVLPSKDILMEHFHVDDVGELKEALSTGTWSVVSYPSGFPGISSYKPVWTPNDDSPFPSYDHEVDGDMYIQHAYHDDLAHWVSDMQHWGSDMKSWHS